jgi:hypothetical protein
LHEWGSHDPLQLVNPSETEIHLSQLSWRSGARKFDPVKKVQAALAFVSFASPAAANRREAAECWSASTAACSPADYRVEKE